MRPKLPTRLPYAAPLPWKPLALAASLALAAGCGPAPAGAEHLTGLADALRAAPGVAPRLSAAAFRACAETVPDGGTIPRARCPADGESGTARLMKIAARAGRDPENPAALHALGLVDLVVDDASGRALDRAVSSLRRAAELAARPAPVLADLAAALLVRAERTQAPRDLLEAYETAEQALRHDPRHPAALYNRALALDRFGLVDEAARDWADYLAVDSVSGWADEARRRSAAALRVSPPEPAAVEGGVRLAAADPQGARELGMDRLLAEWGEAVRAGDARRAYDRLARAAALAEALERRPGGDAGLADAVRAIRAAAGDPDRTRTLARAHREYGAGTGALAALDFAGAVPRLAASAAAADASPVLRDWANALLGTTLLQLRRPEGERVLAGALGADTLRHPALAARARWSLARTRARGEGWEWALGTAEQSARLFARAGERENEGAALTVAAEIRFVVGEPDSGYAAVHRALNRLAPYRASLRLHSLLATSAEWIEADGLHASAGRILGEGVGVAARTGAPVLAAEARFRRARHLAARGDFARAGADLEAARAAGGSILDDGGRTWFTTELAEAEAAVALHADPAAATAALDRAAAAFARIPLPVRQLPALVAAAEARLAARDPAGAAERLAAATRLLDQRRDSIRMEPRRAAVFDAARGVTDRLVLLLLAEGRADAALEYMDGARASLAPAGGPRAAREPAAARSLPGETAVEYARIADTLLAWTVSERGVEVFRSVLDTVRFARTLRELESALERGAREAEVRPGLSLLYGWLVRPVEARLGAGRPLVVVADGEIAGVPFAALWDERRGRYLAEDHAIRFAASLREARRPRARSGADGVVLVADPAFDARAHPLLERLPHARREVGAIAAGEPAAAVLEGAAATPGAVRAALEHAGVVHFAGHAVFDDQRPERSYLVLAPGGAGDDGRLTAAGLAALDLARVRLVVLSACRTVRTGRNRAGGFSGLSGALLAAGAGGAVGSTWEVEDRATSVLMAEFHRAYREGGNGPGALRSAQLALLRSADPALSTPAAWAGFRYAGR